MLEAPFAGLPGLKYDTGSLPFKAIGGDFCAGAGALTASISAASRYLMFGSTTLVGCVPDILLFPREEKSGSEPDSKPPLAFRSPPPCQGASLSAHRGGGGVGAAADSCAIQETSG